jgi:hypothetical protein
MLKSVVAAVAVRPRCRDLARGVVVLAGRGGLASRVVLARCRRLPALDLPAGVVGAAFGGPLRLVGAGALRATLATPIAATVGTAVPTPLTITLRVARTRVLGEAGRGGGQDTREDGTGDNSRGHHAILQPAVTQHSCQA